MWRRRVTVMAVRLHKRGGGARPGRGRPPNVFVVVVVAVGEERGVGGSMVVVSATPSGKLPLAAGGLVRVQRRFCRRNDATVVVVRVKEEVVGLGVGECVGVG